MPAHSPHPTPTVVALLQEAALAADVTAIWRDVRLGRVGDGWQRADYAFDHDWYCEEALHNHLASLQVNLNPKP